MRFCVCVLVCIWVHTHAFRYWVGYARERSLCGEPYLTNGNLQFVNEKPSCVWHIHTHSHTHGATTFAEASYFVALQYAHRINAYICKRIHSKTCTRLELPKLHGTKNPPKQHQVDRQQDKDLNSDPKQNVPKKGRIWYGNGQIQIWKHDKYDRIKRGISTHNH